MSNLLFSHQKEDLISAARIIAEEIIARSQIQNPKTLETKEEFLTQQEAAKFLHVTVGTLIQWKKAGKVPFYKIGRTILFSKRELLLSAQNS